MQAKIEELKKMFGPRIRENEPMSAHTTAKVGGSVSAYIDVDKKDDLIRVVRFAIDKEIPYRVIGGGSNILFSDEGFEGLVIKNNCRHFEVMSMSGRITSQQMNIKKAVVYAESGVMMNLLVRHTVENGLGGLEYHLGLPGTVGGAIYMNSNFPKRDAYVGDTLQTATLLTKTGEIKQVDKSYFKFAYDYSELQKTGEILLSAVFSLTPQDKKELWEKATEALTHRTTSQPKGPSAGCVFRNISLSDAIIIKTPHKTTSAGYLIDKSGLKGKKIGDAMIANEHANFIINTGNATAKDFKKLISLMKKEVYDTFGVKLELEVQTVGF
jgi:UDP-N-acetylenolpyruvoylglucosamine reductase